MSEEESESSLRLEADRISAPSLVAPGPLSAFYVEVGSWGELEPFARRLREAISIFVAISREADFNEDEISESRIPAWMRERWGDAGAHYSFYREDEEWSLQEIIFSFDPDERAWRWWDVTRAFGNIAQVWVDSEGEAVYDCGALRWILYLCGAKAAIGPLLEKSEQWKSQPAIGL